MNLFVRLIFVAVALTAVPANGAESCEKNGLSCVAELCLGDGLTELAALPWERAKVPGQIEGISKIIYSDQNKASEAQLKNWATQFKGDISSAAPYIADCDLTATHSVRSPKSRLHVP